MFVEHVAQELHWSESGSGQNEAKNMRGSNASVVIFYSIRRCLWEPLVRSVNPKHQPNILYKHMDPLIRSTTRPLKYWKSKYNFEQS